MISLFEYKINSAFTDIRKHKNYSFKLSEITEREFTAEEAKCVWIHMAITFWGRGKESDIILSSCGLIRGFDSDDMNLGDRRKKYKELSKYPNKLESLGKDESKYFGKISKHYYKSTIMDLLPEKDESKSGDENESSNDTSDKYPLVLSDEFLQEAYSKYLGKELPTLSFIKEEPKKDSKMSTEGQKPEPKPNSDFTSSNIKNETLTKESEYEKNKINPFRNKKFLSAIIVAIVIIGIIVTTLIVHNHFCSQNTQQEDQNQQMMVTNDDLLIQFKNDIGNEIQKDANKSSLEAKAQTGDNIAEYELGCIYLSENQNKKAAEYFLSSAQKGYAPAQAAISYLHILNYVTSNEKNIGYDFAKKAAEQGNDIGEFLLGYCYQFGTGVNVDYKKAVHWYNLSSTKGNSTAKYFLANLYLTGNGVSKDYQKAAKLFEDAYIDGCCLAAYSIGQMYANGIWFNKDAEKAVEWFLRSAEAGIPCAWVARGYYFDYAKGVEQDYGEAFRCYTNAANLGDPEGQALLSRLYLEGLGVDQNTEIGIKWLLKSAEQNQVEAQMQIALYYFKGEYVERDYLEAEKWLKRASENGNEEATEYLKQIYKINKSN